jgi:hypothetical protein
LHSRPAPTEDLRLRAYSDCWTLPQATNGLLPACGRASVSHPVDENDVARP